MKQTTILLVVILTTACSAMQKSKNNRNIDINTGGSGSVPLYDGEEMAKKGVVFITINYRLGIFGFLAHPELSKESPNKVSGNYGILDQIAALQWVKNNVAAFGGDPNLVTIAGQSRGSWILAIRLKPLTFRFNHS